MELTKDILLERRAALEADALAISGAIQQVDWTLEQMEKEDDSEDDQGYDEPVK